MSFFSSPRERRLWLWALAVVVAIYASLGVTRPFTQLLRNNNLLEPAFILGTLLAGAAILLQGLKARPGGVEIGVGLGVTAVYTILLTRISLPEERTHLIEYDIAAVLVHEALMERAKQGRHVPKPALLAVVIAALLGWLDEGIQALMPSRVYDIRDVGFNFLAVLLAIGASLALSWARERR